MKNFNQLCTFVIYDHYENIHSVTFEFWPAYIQATLLPLFYFFQIKNLLLHLAGVKVGRAALLAHVHFQRAAASVESQRRGLPPQPPQPPLR